MFLHVSLPSWTHPHICFLMSFVYSTAHCVDWSPDSLNQTLVESEGPATLTIRLSITDGTQPEPLDYPLDLQIIYIPITAEGML